MDEREETLGALRLSLELAVEHATSDYIRLTLPTERAQQLLSLLTPDDADVEEADRDELLSAMARIARNICDCDAREGEEAPVSPAEHRGYCHYSLAHSAVPESTEPLVWDDNFALPVPPSSDWWPADIDPLEAKARILAGYDKGERDVLTLAERAEMESWANAELGYPLEDAPEDDSGLSRWYLGALAAFAQDKGLL